MPTVTPDQGLSLPTGPDVANNPAAFNNFVAGVEPRLTRLYVDTADRTARQLVVAENELSGLATENRIEVYNGTTNISLHPRSMWASVRVSVDQVLTASSTVLQNVTSIVTALPAGISGSMFQWTCHIYYDASTVADIKFAFTAPAGSTMRWGMMALATDGVSPSYPTQTASGSTRSAGGTGVGTVLYALINGEMTMGANAGNLQLQAAQNTSDASVTTIFARTNMEVWRKS